MKTIALLVALAACGGKPKPMPPTNKDNTGTGRAATPAKVGAAAKVIKRDQAGGIVELVGDDRGASMEKASTQMSAHCGPGNYRIVQEGEEVVAEGSRETVWRVHYQCGG